MSINKIRALRIRNTLTATKIEVFEKDFWQIYDGNMPLGDPEKHVGWAWANAYELLSKDRFSKGQLVVVYESLKGSNFMRFRNRLLQCASDSYKNKEHEWVVRIHGVDQEVRTEYLRSSTILEQKQVPLFVNLATESV